MTDKLTSLKYLTLHNNQLEALPDLTNLTKMNYLSIQNNKFTFESLTETNQL